jgi:MFS family permease
MAASMMLIVYYLPIWFQAVKGTSAFESGIRMIPTVLSLVVSSIISGQITTRIGYYVPSMIVSPVIASIGAGLLTTLNQDTGHAMWIGYQVLFGFGLGLAMQITSLAAQAVLPREDVSIGTAVMFFSQQLGGAIFVSVGQNVFINDLVEGLVNVPGLSPMSIVKTGATELQKIVPAQYLPVVLEKYNYALTRTFVIATGMIAASIVGSFAMEWKNIKKSKKRVTAPAAEKEADKKNFQTGEKDAEAGE